MRCNLESALVDPSRLQPLRRTTMALFCLIFRNTEIRHCTLYNISWYPFPFLIFFLLRLIESATTPVLCGVDSQHHINRSFALFVLSECCAFSTLRNWKERSPLTQHPHQRFIEDVTVWYIVHIQRSVSRRRTLEFLCQQRPLGMVIISTSSTPVGVHGLSLSSMDRVFWTVVCPAVVLVGEPGTRFLLNKFSIRSLTRMR